MSEVIVRMEMPMNCAYCGLVDVSGRCVLLGTFALDKQVRLPKCPIIGVLPEQHGDLVDRNVMHKEIQLWKSNATDTITMCFLYHVERLLMSIKSIIEAEKGEYE